MPRGLPGTAGALLGAAGALLAAAVFFGDGSTYAPLVWIGGLAVLAAAVWLALVAVGAAPFARLDGAGVVFLALFAWFVVWNGVSIVWSLQPDRSWEYFNRGLIYFAFVLLGILAASAFREAPRALALVLLGIFAAALVWALAGKAIPDLYEDGARLARLRAPLEYWNALALVAAMTLPLALWAVARREHPRVLRLGSVVLVYAAVVALLLTYSRGGAVVALLAAAGYLAVSRQRVDAIAALLVAVPPAAVLSFWAFTQPGLVEDGRPYDERLSDGLQFGAWLVIGAVLVAAVAYYGVEHEEQWRSRLSVTVSRRRTLVWALALAVVAVLGVSKGDPVGWTRDGLREFTNPVSEAGAGPGRLGDFSSNSRWTWWTEATELWQHNPAVGTGAGTFSVARRPLRTNTTVATEPHNLALQFLSETGLIGLLVVLGAGTAAGFAVVRGLRNLDEANAAAGSALAIVLLAYVAHALLDYDWDFVAVTAPFFVALGVLVAAGRPVGAHFREPFFAAGAAVIGLTIVGSLAAPWLATREVSSAYAALDRDDLPGALDASRRARMLNPLAVEPLFAEATAEQATGDDGSALELYVRAVELQPENPRTWFELGRFELDIGLREAGIRHLIRSRELDRWGPADPVLGRLGIA